MQIFVSPCFIPLNLYHFSNSSIVIVTVTVWDLPPSTPESLTPVGIAAPHRLQTFRKAKFIFLELIFGHTQSPSRCQGFALPIPIFELCRCLPPIADAVTLLQVCSEPCHGLFPPFSVLNLLVSSIDDAVTLLFLLLLLHTPITPQCSKEIAPSDCRSQALARLHQPSSFRKLNPATAARHFLPRAAPGRLALPHQLRAASCERPLAPGSRWS